MYERWTALAALTLARTTMGVQFQSVAALAPDLTGRLALSPAGFGLLIGLYLLPGIVVAIPGGWLGARFGERRLVVIALALMALGGLALLAPSGPVVFAGRVVAGIGGVILNVLVTKMVADRFSGGAAPAAMGILVTSWPLGLALAMVVLPPFTGSPLAAAAPALLAALCVPLVWRMVRRDAPVPPVPPVPPDIPKSPDAPRNTAAPASAIRAGRAAAPELTDAAPSPPARARLGLQASELRAAISAGGVWAFYNAGFVLFLAFGAPFLVAGGMEQVQAARTVSLMAWLIIPTLVVGGWLAGRSGRPDTLLVASLSAAAVLLAALALGAPPLPTILALGLTSGPGGPLVMLLPARVVAPARRGIAMGVYFTCYYIAMAAGPPLAGALAVATGSAAAPLWLAALCFALALGCFAAFRMGLRPGSSSA